MSNLKAVFFDLDGTLIDTAPDFIYVVNKMLADADLPLLAEAQIRNTVSEGSRALITLAFGLRETDPGFSEKRQQLLDLYEQHLAENSRPFPGINDLLTELGQRNIAWGIATNKPEHYTSLLMQQLNLEPAPVVVLSPDQVPNAKPAPDSLYICCEAADCAINEAVYIGDHKRDIDCGKNAGMTTIAAAYGYIGEGDSAESWQADHLVTEAKDIWPLLQELYALYT